MAGKFSDIRALHERGLITICFERNLKSSKFLTSGTDGTVYIWDQECLKNNKAPEIKSVGDATHSSLAWINEDVYMGYTSTDIMTGVDKMVIGRASINDLNNSTQIMTFSLDITSIDVGSSFLVAGSSDFVVKKLNLGNSACERVETSGVICSIKIDPNEEVYAVSTCDGTVSIYDLNSNEELTQHKKLFPAFNNISTENSRVLVCWSPDGTELFVPCLGAVKVIGREGWKLTSSTFQCTGNEEAVFSTCCVSHCGTFLAASTLTNKICVWRISDRSLTATFEYKRIATGKNTISCIGFSPFNKRDIIITDINEGLSVLSGAIPAVCAPAATDFSSMTSGTGEGEENEDEDDDDDDVTVVRKSRASAFIDDFADEDNNTRMSSDLGAVKRKYGFNESSSRALEEFGFEPIGRYTDDDKPSDSRARDILSMPSSAAPVTKVISYKPTPIPSRFVSSSTPSNLSQRYLKWNNYGMVRSYTSDTDSSIEIEFHDVSVHSEIMLDNLDTNFTLADISDHAVALANRPEEKGDQSELLVIHVASWDPESKRWNAKMPLKDGALDVLVTRQVVAVLTERNNVRIFTLSGTQRQIISHAGPILTAAAFDTRIAIASITGGEMYQEGNKKPQYQHTVTVYDVDGKNWYRNTSNVSSVSLPLRGELEWLGYTNKGQLASMDSEATIRLLAPGKFWVPIFEGELKTKSDAIWPITVVEGAQRQFRYLYCKGSKYPIVAVKMAPIVAPWCLPLCSAESDKSKLEQELFVNELAHSVALSDGDSGSLSELSSYHLQSLIKLFALACKSERETRASDLAQLVTSAKGIQNLVNYAAKLKKSTLADKVAAAGRDNMEDSIFANTTQDSMMMERTLPRRLSIKKKSAYESPMVTFRREPVAPLRENDYEEDSMEDTIPETQPIASEAYSDADMQSQASVIPIQKFNRNPFKRDNVTDSMDTSSLSVFEQLETSIDKPRKRMNKDDEESRSTSAPKKQMKLSFGATNTSTKGKENTGPSAFDLWLEEKEASMRTIFNGDAYDFTKFCMQQFRMLPATERKEWKAKADGTVDN